MSTLVRTHQILVRAPLQTAFDYVSDISKHPEWNGGLRIDPISSDSIGIGKEYISHGEVAVQKDRPNKVTVSEYEPPRKFGFLASDPDFGKVSHIFTFTEQGGGVLIRRSMTVSLNPIVALLFRFFVYPLIGSPSMDKSLRALKAKLEET